MLIDGITHKNVVTFKVSIIRLLCAYDVAVSNISELYRLKLPCVILSDCVCPDGFLSAELTNRKKSK